jgi:creatinine amidohydrolase
VNGGLGLLRQRVHAIPGRLRALDPAAIRAPAGAPARVVATGAGSSLEHARLLVALLVEELGLPARCAAPSAFLADPGPRADELLVVFSQGLSPNARLALAKAPAWGAALLVTGEESGAEDPGGAAARARFREAGGEVLTLPVPRESGLLLRVVGPALGTLVCIELARSLAAAQGITAPWPALSAEALARAVEDAAARGRALRASLPGDPLRGALALLAAPETARAGSLARKLLEGLLVPLPPIFDLLDFAHGGFQQLFGEHATLLALSRADEPLEAALLERTERMLDAGRHRLLRLESRLPAPFALLEHGALLDELLLGALEERGLDPSLWPGQERDAPLYALDAPPEDAAAGALARLTWPELGGLLEGGARTALVPLGSTEQHGPHLPFATDTRVADALAERLCRRLPGAVRLPALPFGCASEHLAFPGTVSLREETLAAVLEDAVASLDRHGFEAIFVFSAHGGNAEALRRVEGRLARAARRARVVVFADAGAVAATLHGAAARLGVDASAAGHHAGEVETSILLALAPADVRRECAEAGLLDPREPASVFYPDLRANAPSGVVGDPRGADPGRAGAYLDAWTELLATAFEGAKKRQCTKGTNQA